MTIKMGFFFPTLLMVSEFSIMHLRQDNVALLKIVTGACMASRW
jgi:hypothetical protein